MSMKQEKTREFSKVIVHVVHHHLSKYDNVTSVQEEKSKNEFKRAVEAVVLGDDPKVQVAFSDTAKSSCIRGKVYGERVLCNARSNAGKRVDASNSSG